jgi:hypothetical protein
MCDFRFVQDPTNALNCVSRNTSFENCFSTAGSNSEEVEVSQNRFFNSESGNNQCRYPGDHEEGDFSEAVISCGNCAQYSDMNGNNLCGLVQSDEGSCIDLTAYIYIFQHINEPFDISDHVK